MCYPVVSIKAAAPERTKTSQLYVSAPNNGAALTATANSVGSWEKYVLISRGGSQIVLRSAASHNFVAQIGANFFATGSTISQAVTLTRHGGDSSVNFQVPGSNYITAPLDNGSDPNNLLGRNSGPLEATRGAADGAPGSWETFSIRNESPEPK